ncbi:MAG TPA: ABC transporter permease [Terracidiphilus sp.]|nr:ABC transporter permease [Terracidiphilus sp.]
MSLRSLAISVLARPCSWFRAVLQRNRLEAEMEAELAHHVESLTADLIRAGQLPAQAARNARISLGAAMVHKEEMRASLGLRWWDELWADLRYGVRILRKSPGFTFIAATSLALAIGANTTIFSVAKQLLYERLDVPNAANLRLLAWTGTRDHVAVHHVWGDWDRLPGGRVTSTAFSYPAFQQLRAQNQVLDDLFAFKRMTMIATIREDGQTVRAEMVSGNYFGALGVLPQLGRVIEPVDDAVPGQGAVAVIGDGMWERVFARSPAVLGQTLKLNDIPFTIVGVAPKGFSGARDVQIADDLFIPLSMQPLVFPRSGSASLFVDSTRWWVNVMGRARAAGNDTTARAALDSQLAAIVRSTMPVRKGEDLPRIDLRDGSRGIFEEQKQYARPMAVLTTLVGLVLLLACANIANLMLARGAQREREMSVRLALGAGRVRILRQMLVESLLLAALGGAGGVVIGYFGRNAIPKMTENAWERTDFHIHFDWKVFTFTAGITILTGLLFGLAPAWAATRAELNHGPNEMSLAATRRRKGAGGKLLVGIQIALSTLLVIGAGLFLRTLVSLSSVEIGFKPDHLLLGEIDPPRNRYPAGKDIALNQRLEQAFAAVPGVESVSPAMDAYVSGNLDATDFLSEGEKLGALKHQEEDYNLVGNQFFSTLKIPILAGRAFGPQDTANSPRVAVINESLARTRFHGQNPIGKRFVTDPHDADGSGVLLGRNSIEIVGICGDTRYVDMRSEPPPQFFLPYVQQPSVSGMIYEIRTAMEAEAIVPGLREVVRQVDPDLALLHIRTQNQQVTADLQQESTFVTLTSGFGLLALLLASVGIYGIMAYSVAIRRNEIGIRLALGAQPGQVRSMILRESTALAGVGIVAGLTAALALTRLVKSMLYGIQPYDPVTLTVGVFTLLAVALAASWIPARRAAAVQPMDALRHD